MTTPPRMNLAVGSARKRLALAREKFRQQHDSGAPAVQVCARFTESLERIVLDLYRSAVVELNENGQWELGAGSAVIAHGGFGRREMAPYSDVDLMLLHRFPDDQRIVPLSRRFSQHLYDAGLDVGFAARNTQQACELALQDGTVLTALSESRLLVGGDQLFEDFRVRLARQTRRYWRRMVQMVYDARAEERAKYGETVFLLEPNVKRSSGGLRGLQYIRWLAFARFQQTNLEWLVENEQLTLEELRQLSAAREFLLWLRNDLHLSAGRVNDVLDRAEQLRLAELRHYPPTDGLRPVEQFMREYFSHTASVREIASHFAASVQPRSPLRWLVDPLVGHQHEGDFWVGPSTIATTRRGLPKLKGDLGEVLRLLDLANLYDKRIDHDTWQAIRQAMLQVPSPDIDQPLPRPIADRFLSLLSQPAQLGELLRRLHNLRVLEQLVPGMSHARGLLQFNAYHRYTVDEHSIRAVEAATHFQQHPGVAGDVYRALKHKHLLHLALLMHDLGKGYGKDHSEVGRGLAEQATRRLGMPEHDVQTVAFLVHKHLRMNHLAQQHDIHDEKVIVPFAVEVGSPENLQMLYLLTLADLAAVGPGVLNEWKEQLLTNLYQHTLHLLASDSPADAMNEGIRRRREEIRTLSRKFDDRPWWNEQVDSLPSYCLFAGPPEQIVEELERLHRLPHNQAVAWGRFLPDRNVVEYTVGTYEEMAPGIFHRLTGALSSMRQQILSAEINTLAHGMVLDRFYVQDQDYAGPPDASRIDEVTTALVDALNDPTGKPPVFKRLWQDRARPSADVVKILPTQVSFDNSTSDCCTIVAVFAYDRMGLLYTIARTLFEQGLSVSIARIGTHLDQVVDAFYVTDRATGAKITSDDRLDRIQFALLQAIEQLAKE